MIDYCIMQRNGYQVSEYLTNHSQVGAMAMTNLAYVYHTEYILLIPERKRGTGHSKCPNTSIK